MPKVQCKIWNHFDKCTTDKKGICKYCHGSFSYRSSITNLKSHLKIKHIDEYHKLIQDNDAEPANVIYIAEFPDDEEIGELYIEDVPSESKKRKRNYLSLWNFFKKSTEGDKTVICNYCLGEFSYKMSIESLTAHIKQEHTAEYNEFLNLSESVSINVKSEDTLTLCDDEELYVVESISSDAEILSSDIKIWKFFEKSNDGSKTAVCNYCLQEISFNSSVENLKSHLKTEHIDEYNDFLNLPVSEFEDEYSPLLSGDEEWLEEKETSKRKKPNRIITIWKFFEPSGNGNRTAICNYCLGEYSYKTTITNLKAHLRQKHIAAYNEFLSLSGRANILNSSSSPNHETFHGENISIKIKTPKSNLTSLNEDLYGENISSNTKKCKPIWTFFERSNDDTIAICKYCRLGFPYKKSLMNLKVHLKHKHAKAYNKLLKISSASLFDKVDLYEENIDGNNKNHVSSGSAEASEGYINAVDINGPPSKIQKITHIDSPKILKYENKQKIDLKLLKFIVYDFQPLTIVNDSGFCEFVQALNPYYKLPDQKTLSVDFLQKAYEKRLEEMKMFVDKKANSVCITVDCWTSCTLDNYMGITAHFITEDPVELKSVLIHCGEFDGRHSGTTMYGKIKEVLEKWALYDKVSIFITDNGPHVENAVMHFEMDGWSHFVCFAHKINIVVQRALDQINKMTSKVHEIVSNILIDTAVEENLLMYQTNQQNITEPKTVIKPIPNRWNSVYLMLERFVDLRESLQAIILNSNLPNISMEDWRCIEQACNILKPFYEASIEMSVDKYLVASKAYILTLNLINICNSYSGLQDLHPLIRTLANKLKDDLSCLLEDMEINERISLCIILDPRFKLKALKNKEKIEHIKNNVKKFLDEINQANQNNSEEIETSTADPISSNHGSFSLWCSFDNETSETSKATNAEELENYLAGSIIRRTESPFKYWQEHKTVYPTLYQLFIKYCNVIATSFPCEQFFSESGYITSDRRTRLSSTNLAQVMFLNVNKISNFT